MKKRLLLLLCGVLIFGFALPLWQWRDLFWNRCQLWIDRTYYVSFQWDNGIKDLRITDKKTGKQEANRELRAITSKEAASMISQIIDWTRLARAEGQFELYLGGCGQPYLTARSIPSLPDLEEFISAAGDWDLPVVQEKLTKGMNVNAREIGTGRTALIWAAKDDPEHANPVIRARIKRLSDSRTFEFLLDAGADPNSKDVEGTTALMRAYGSQVQLLLRHGADINAKDKDGRTALILAVLLSKIEVLRTLLDTHAEVNARDKEGWTALMYASWEDKAEQTRLLLAAGADAQIKNAKGDTALSIASREGHADIIALLKSAQARH